MDKAAERRVQPQLVRHGPEDESGAERRRAHRSCVQLAPILDYDTSREYQLPPLRSSF